MGTTDNLIRSACPLFACRICRTKTGWRRGGGDAARLPGLPLLGYGRIHLRASRARKERWRLNAGEKDPP